MNQELNNLRRRLTPLTEPIAKFAEPLEALGVPFFGYARIYKDNTFLYLCNKPEWYDVKYEQEFCDFNGFVCTSDIRRNLFTKCLFTGEPDKNIRVLSSLHALGFWNSIDYYYYTGEYIEITHFGGSVDQPRITELYLNRSEFFEGFIYHFRHHFADLIEPPDPALLAPLNDYFREPTYDPDGLPPLATQEKLPLAIKDKTYLLSPRQVQCLACLLRGKTAKKTAQSLNLSYRTIEFYLRLMKEKFACSDLSDVLSELSYQQIAYILSHAEMEFELTRQ